eukprot:11224638-Lingulodinium_polyedra.AAC.1
MWVSVSRRSRSALSPVRKIGVGLPRGAASGGVSGGGSGTLSVPVSLSSAVSCIFRAKLAELDGVTR